MSKFLRAERNPPHSASLSVQYLPCLTTGADKVPQQCCSCSLCDIYIQVKFIHLHPYRSDPNKTNLLICKSPNKFMVHVLSFLPYQINYQNLKIKATPCIHGSSRLPSGPLLQPCYLTLVPPSYLKDHKMLFFFSLKYATSFSETQTPRFHTHTPLSQTHWVQVSIHKSQTKPEPMSGKRRSKLLPGKWSNHLGAGRLNKTTVKRTHVPGSQLEVPRFYKQK